MEPVQVKIFTPNPLPRLDYIASIILGDILGLKWEVVTARNDLADAAVINYSTERIEGSFKVAPHPLLSESGVMQREIVISGWNGLPVFFQTEEGSDLPFDIFAASFWLITRYEEHLPFEPDRHGRFRASSSLAFRNGFLDKPVIDLWVKKLSELLKERFPGLAFRKNEFRSILTVDIDIPYAYRGRNIFRHLGGVLSDLINNPRALADRFKVLTGAKDDPYEVFGYIIDSIRRSGSDARFFISVGDHSEYDKNPSWKNEDYRKLIRKISSEFKTGVHPSYHSASKPGLIKTESERLKDITGNEVKASRFHYLRIAFPDSFRRLEETGITEDYSLCFHDEPGFRAGIARPFIFYDLSEERKTSLRVIPFQVMDVSLFEYKNLGPQESRDQILRLMNETRRAEGLFVSLWHNTSLPASPAWKEWRSVFESMLREQQS